MGCWNLTTLPRLPTTDHVDPLDYKDHRKAAKYRLFHTLPALYVL
jgi:hypothetical protein